MEEGEGHEIQFYPVRSGGTLPKLDRFVPYFTNPQAVLDTLGLTMEDVTRGEGVQLSVQLKVNGELRQGARAAQLRYDKSLNLVHWGLPQNERKGLVCTGLRLLSRSSQGKPMRLLLLAKHRDVEGKEEEEEQQLHRKRKRQEEAAETSSELDADEPGSTGQPSEPSDTEAASSEQGTSSDYLQHRTARAGAAARKRPLTQLQHRSTPPKQQRTGRGQGDLAAAAAAAAAAAPVAVPRLAERLAALEQQAGEELGKADALQQQLQQGQVRADGLQQQLQQAHARTDALQQQVQQAQARTDALQQQAQQAHARTDALAATMARVCAGMVPFLDMCELRPKEMEAEMKRAADALKDAEGCVRDAEQRLRACREAQQERQRAKKASEVGLLKQRCSSLQQSIDLELANPSSQPADSIVQKILDCLKVEVSKYLASWLPDGSQLLQLRSSIVGAVEGCPSVKTAVDVKQLQDRLAGTNLLDQLQSLMTQLSPPGGQAGAVAEAAGADAEASNEQAAVEGVAKAQRVLEQARAHVKRAADPRQLLEEARRVARGALQQQQEADAVGGQGAVAPQLGV